MDWFNMFTPKRLRHFIADDNPQGIEGVRYYPKKVFRDSRGAIKHGVRIAFPGTPHTEDVGYDEVGEVYFSTVMPHALKAWHLHSLMTLRYLCVYGTVWIGLFDDRAISPTRGNSILFMLDDNENYGMLEIPPGIWNGFQSNEYSATICNIASLPHDPDEITRLSPKAINEKWNLEWPFPWE